jgi:hypothetical protein
MPLKVVNRPQPARVTRLKNGRKQLDAHWSRVFSLPRHEFSIVPNKTRVCRTASGFEDRSSSPKGVPSPGLPRDLGRTFLIGSIVDSNQLLCLHADSRGGINTSRCECPYRRQSCRGDPTPNQSGVPEIYDGPRNPCAKRPLRIVEQWFDGSTGQRKGEKGHLACKVRDAGNPPRTTSADLIEHRCQHSAYQ